MSEGYADSYYQQFPDHTPILFMASPSELGDILAFENIAPITPPALSDLTLDYEFHVYEDTAPFPHDLPPISIEIPIATSPMNTRGPPSPLTTPYAGLVSLSQAADVSSPRHTSHHVRIFSIPSAFVHLTTPRL